MSYDCTITRAHTNPPTHTHTQEHIDTALEQTNYTSILLEALITRSAGFSRELIMHGVRLEPGTFNRLINDEQQYADHGIDELVRGGNATRRHLQACYRVNDTLRWQMRMFASRLGIKNNIPPSS